MKKSSQVKLRTTIIKNKINLQPPTSNLPPFLFFFFSLLPSFSRQKLNPLPPFSSLPTGIFEKKKPISPAPRDENGLIHVSDILPIYPSIISISLFWGGGSG